MRAGQDGDWDEDGHEARNGVADENGDWDEDEDGARDGDGGRAHLGQVFSTRGITAEWVLAVGSRPGRIHTPQGCRSAAIWVPQGHWGPALPPRTTPALSFIFEPLPTEPMPAKQTAFICSVSQRICFGSLFYCGITLNCALCMSPFIEKSTKYKGGVIFFGLPLLKQSASSVAGPRQSPPSTPSCTVGTPDSQDTGDQHAGNAGIESGQLKLRFLLN